MQFDIMLEEIFNINSVTMRADAIFFLNIVFALAGCLFNVLFASTLSV